MEERKRFVTTTVRRMAVLPLLLLFPAATFILTPVQGATVSISGTVKDSDGKPIGAAEVYAVKAPGSRLFPPPTGRSLLPGPSPMRRRGPGARRNPRSSRARRSPRPRPDT